MKQKNSLRDMCVTGIFAALTVIMAQIAIPIPISPVPITLQLFAIYLSSIILGRKLGSLSQVIYVGLGAIGIPVFANFSGGIQNILGPTGGFIISFPIIAWVIGYSSEKVTSVLGKIMILLGSLFICYFIGTLQLSFVTKMSIKQSIAVAVVPFVAFDVVKIILAFSIGTKVRKHLNKAGLL